MLIKYIRKTYHRQILEQLIKEHAHLIQGKILDIGSKNRRYDYLFKGQITAIDIVPDHNRNIVFGNIERGIDFPDKYFDSIICLEVFEYLNDYQRAIDEIYRLLKKSGWAIISMPFMMHEHDDNIRFSSPFIISKFNKFSYRYHYTIGNGYTVIWDILLKKTRVSNRLIRTVLWVLILPYFLLLKLIKIEKNVDQYYSGVFVILQK